jgi:hypothetical protein
VHEDPKVKLSPCIDQLNVFAYEFVDTKTNKIAKKILIKFLNFIFPPNYYK